MTTTLTAQQIRDLKLNRDDVMGFEFRSDNHYLTINGERVVCFTNSKARRKSFDKIKRMGFALGWKAPLITDEEKGIVQAHKNGENPFAYTIICADPKRNKIVR